ncbi:MAG: hypothetical protein ACXWF2_14250, partial [Usitatibacter sp.]
MAPPAHEEIERAVDIALLQANVASLTKSVEELTKQVSALVQSQIVVKGLGGAIVYLVPIASMVIS